MTCNINHQHCQHPVNVVSQCPTLAKIKVTRPNPVAPTIWPKYFCYSHLMSFIKDNRGQFLIERM